MTMPAPEVPQAEWKSRTYVLGALAGAVVGFLSAYLYARAVQEDALERGSKPRALGTGDMIGLGLTALGLVRQVAELGRPASRKR